MKEKTLHPLTVRISDSTKDALEKKGSALGHSKTAYARHILERETKTGKGAK